MLTRIYGTAFASKKELEEYLARQEMAKQRDHRKLGENWTSSASTTKRRFPFFHLRHARHQRTS